MCLSVPGKIVEILNDEAMASVGGTLVKIGLQLLEDVQLNDYVLIHAGFGIQKIDEKEAEETLKIIREMEQME